MPREYFKGNGEEERAYSPAIKVTGGTTIYLAGVGIIPLPLLGSNSGRNIVTEVPQSGR